ncbi:MAG: hypothetical protein HKO56_02935 [Bacteroidia bacterium]|nr:hypothetical protein [Bacteroidia bacterium]NNM15589.1 hypothetical protein [Bacteroidia bacterium]
MKNNRNLFALVTLILLLSTISCQKENFNEDANFRFASSDGDSKIECIDFEIPSWHYGQIVNTVFTTDGGNAIEVYGVNPSYKGTNAAMIFNSTNPLQFSGDYDLASPNERFGGSGQGKGGALEPFANRDPLGKILIVSEDLEAFNPNDIETESRVVFDFLDWGYFKLHSMTVIDIEESSNKLNASTMRPRVELQNKDGRVLAEAALPYTGDNGVANVFFDRNIGNVVGATKLVVFLPGSGGIDNICFEKAEY